MNQRESPFNLARQLKTLPLWNRAGRAGMAALASVALYIALKVAVPDLPEWLEHLMLVLTAVMGLHLLDRAYLWRDIADSFRETVTVANALLKQAADCGVTGFYGSRRDVQNEVVDIVGRASRRVWLLGVAFSEKVSLPALLPVLNEKIGNGVEVRVLLLDALRSTAVFRTVLESSYQDAKAILETDRAESPAYEPYFQQRLYRDFDYLCNTLSDYSLLERSVRFYGHAPLCWLVICDETALYQPYTFGRGALGGPGTLSIGDQMPVFRLQRQAGGRLFETLEDHFWKLWVTSDLDLFHIKARREDRERVLQRIFSERVQWLNHVSAVLGLINDGTHSKIDQRLGPRQPCEATPPGLTVSWSTNGSSHEVAAHISDCSSRGMALLVEGDDLPADGATIQLRNAVPSQPRAARFMMSYLVTRNDNRFVVRWRDVSRKCIGIEGAASVRKTGAVFPGRSTTATDRSVESQA